MSTPAQTSPSLWSPDRRKLNELIVKHDPEKVHAEDQRKCVCGEIIGFYDGAVVTTDPYGHLVEKILAAGFKRPMGIETTES